MDLEDFSPDVNLDVPAAYAVYSLVMDERNETVIDTRYVYVNQLYCRMVGKKKEELIGHLFTKVYNNASHEWFEYCRKAVQEGQIIRDRMYSEEIGHWLEFEVAPAGKDLAAFIFLNVDEDNARRTHLERKNRTDSVIIRLAKILTGPEKYEEAIQHALEELSREIHPDRLYILETDGKTVSNTFEWCREGVVPEIDTLQNLPYDEYIGGWEKFLVHNTSVVIEDIEVLKKDDPIDYYNLKRQNIHSLMDAPIYSEGKLIGYIGADNYEISDAMNTQEILETVSYFLSAKILNHRLLQKLDYMSYHDMLTGAHNRNAMMKKLVELESQRIPVGVLYGDANGLKRTNDKQGHIYGNRLLKNIAEELIRFWGLASTYRAGGDEFVVLAVGMGKKEFFDRCHAFYAHINQEDRADMSIALGWEWAEDGLVLHQVLNLADLRMYEDKKWHYRKMEVGSENKNI